MNAIPIRDAMPMPPKRGFSDVNTWIFDLDNTLYPPDSALWPQIDERITLFLHDLFGLDGLSSRALQKYYYQRYGTTLRGLMQEHGIDPTGFLAFAHDIDRSSLPPHPPLEQAIGALPGRKLIMTNGSADHAMQTARQLGIDHHFEDVFDIVAADFVPKPDRAAYLRFFERNQIDPARSAMFEDLAPNLAVPHAEGMTTVLVVPPEQMVDHRDDWEKHPAAAVHIDHVTADLAAFLATLAPSVRGVTP